MYYYLKIFSQPIHSHIPNLKNYAQVSTEVGGEVEDLIVEPVKSSWRAYYLNISNVLNNGDELIVKPTQILEVMRVYDAAMLSSESNEAIQLS